MLNSSYSPPYRSLTSDRKILPEEVVGKLSAQEALNRLSLGTTGIAAALMNFESHVSLALQDASSVPVLFASLTTRPENGTLAFARLTMEQPLFGIRTTKQTQKSDDQSSNELIVTEQIFIGQEKYPYVDIYAGIGNPYWNSRQFVAYEQTSVKPIELAIDLDQGLAPQDKGAAIIAPSSKSARILQTVMLVGEEQIADFCAQPENCNIPSYVDMLRKLAVA
ncbi:MAG: hypothetical protein KDD62_00990 [Bdellovibrionales bacterium]|nr:hypothetical protein [Bdellovibrionales bacterium]